MSAPVEPSDIVEKVAQRTMWGPRMPSRFGYGPWSQEKKEAFTRDYLGGLSYSDLDERYGSAFYTMRKKLGLPSRSALQRERWAQKGGPNAPWKYENEILVDVWNEALLRGFCQVDILERLDRSWGAIRTQARKLSLPALPRFCVACHGQIEGRAPQAQLCAVCHFNRPRRIDGTISLDRSLSDGAVPSRETVGSIIVPASYSQMEW
jgi:hypothetical protein